jgi:hypothetical protein
MRTERDIWRYPTGLDVTGDLTGYSIEAIDGGIGKIDECTTEASGNSIVVDTGPWIFGKKVLLPGGVIDRVDHDTETVFVNRTKDEIKNAPEFDESNYKSDTYRTEVGGYYGEGGRGYREYRSSRDDL